MSDADYALQFLDFLEIKLFNKGKRVLEYKGDPEYEIKPLGTKIKIGLEIEGDEVQYEIMSFEEFDQLGYAIRSSDKVLWKPRQYRSYSVMRKAIDRIGMSYDAFKKSGITIQKDAGHRRFRLMGENVIPDPRLRIDSGIGPWIVYDRDSPRQLKQNKSTGKLSLGKFSPKKNVECDYVEIEEIPLIISDDKKIVCMRKENVPPRFVVTGASGRGKSTFMNGATSRVHELWGDAVGWLIDPQNQFYDISFPQDYSEFIKYINYVGEEPRPMPAIQFYLACKYPGMMVHPNISFNLTLDYEDFLRRYKFFSYGMKDWEIEGSERYLKMIIPYIKNVRTLDEFEARCYQHIPGANDEKRQDMKSMIGKLVPTMGSIFAEGFTSNLFHDDITTDELEIEFKDGYKMKGHPFIMAMEAGLVPVINTSMNPDKPWVRNFLANIMQKIMEHQKMMQLKNRRIRMNIVADELQAIYEMKTRRTSDNASYAFQQMFRQGRFNDIGVWVNTQSLERVDPELLKNATHIGCVYTQSVKERKMIKELFELPKEVTDMLGQLKTQEIMIFSKEPFITYDRWGKKEVVNKTWFKGRIIPPFNYHKCPTITKAR